MEGTWRTETHKIRLNDVLQRDAIPPHTIQKGECYEKTEFHLQDWAIEQSSDDKKLRYD